MWKPVYGSVRGTMHLEDGTPCQDACRIELIPWGGQLYLVSACSDGAGSASHAHEGSKIACDSFIELAQADIASNSSENWVARDWALSLCTQIQQRLIQRAQEIGVSLRELACTLLAAIISEDRAVFFQIGDGAMIVSINGHLRTVFWPQSGEFTNTTNFLSDSDFEDTLCHIFSYSYVEELAAFTDGLERLILKFEDRSVFTPFLVPMLNAMRQEECVQKFFDPLKAFLDSPKVNERTNDDKTLILATRIQAQRYAEAVL